MTPQSQWIIGDNALRLTQAVLAAALAFLPLAQAGSAHAADKVRFVQSTTGLLFVPSMVAKELGMFAAEGIDADILTGFGGAEAMAAVIGGNAEIYVGAPSTSLRAHEKGVDSKIFAAGMTQYASNVVVTKEWADARGITADSPFEKKLEAMKGGRWGVLGIGSGTHQLVQFLSKKAGVDPVRDITVTNITQAPAMLATFQQRRIDGFAASSPTSDAAVKEHGGVMLFNTTRGEVKDLDGFLYIAFIGREAWLKANPALAKRTLTAIQKAVDAIHAPATADKARDAIWQKYHAQTDKAFFDAIWAYTIPAWPKTIAMTPDMAKRVVGFLNEFSTPGYDASLADKGFDFDTAKGFAK